MCYSSLLVFIVLLSQMIGGEDLQELLGITKKELEDRLKLVSKIETLEIWQVLTAIQQERLRHAIILDKKPPPDWTRFRTYESIMKAENSDYLWNLTHREPHIRNFLINALSAIPHEDLVEAASGKSWWKELNNQEQKELSTLILNGRMVPLGKRSWREAIQDKDIGKRILRHRDLLQYSQKVSTNLQKVLGITDSELQERLETLSRIQNLEIWDTLTGVQQQRLRHGVILNKRPPPIWIRLSSYADLLKPENANFLWRLTHIETRLRNFFMNRLPTIPHEDVVQAASGKSWWSILSDKEQRQLSILILTGKEVPSGWQSWREAVQDQKLPEWIEEHRDILSFTLRTYIPAKANLRMINEA